jgi:hypothetical protein
MKTLFDEEYERGYDESPPLITNRDQLISEFNRRYPEPSFPPVRPRDRFMSSAVYIPFVQVVLSRNPMGIIDSYVQELLSETSGPVSLCLGRDEIRRCFVITAMWVYSG